MVSKFSYKWGLHALCGHEFHTLETSSIEFWTQWVSVTAAPEFPASDNILSE